MQPLGIEHSIWAYPLVLFLFAQTDFCGNIYPFENEATYFGPAVYNDFDFMAFHHYLILYGNSMDLIKLCYTHSSASDIYLAV
jgi:hypothetical protein